MPTMLSLALPVWLILAASTAVSAASYSEWAHKVKESVSPPRGWNRLRPAPADHTISLRIGLPQPMIVLRPCTKSTAPLLGISIGFQESCVGVSCTFGFESRNSASSCRA